ncbi:MAG: hypothetical protein IH945_14170, partial [Armatimonadetes bacterium]|nr:hypothetical protein [Armatimonadota bacterium]
GKELNLALKPSGSVNKDYFLIRFKDVPVQEALDKIAETLNANWKQKGDVTYLGRSRAQEMAERQQAIQEQAAAIEKALVGYKVNDEYTLERAKQLIEQLLPMLERAGGRDRAFAAQIASLNKQAPLVRCMVRLVQEIGFERLADVPSGETVQYVASPNAGQRQLPNGSAMQLWQKENEIQRVALEQTLALDRLGEGAYYSPHISLYRDRLPLQIETMLSVNRGSQDGFQVRLNIEGLGSYSLMVPVASETMTLPDALARQEGKYTPTALEKAMGEQAFLIFGGGEETSVTPVPEIAEVLADPVANESLSILGSGWIMASAKQLGKNLVAVLSDEASIAPVMVLGQKQTNYSNFWNVMNQMGRGYRVSLDDKWLTMYPKAAGEVRSERVDRVKWRALIRSHVKGDPPSLEEIAGFAALSDNTIAMIIAMLSITFVYGDLPSLDAINDGDIDVLRIYGRLNPQQKMQARKRGVELPLSGLAANMVGPARRIVFNRNARVEEKPREDFWDGTTAYYVPGDQSNSSRLLGGGLPQGSLMRVVVLSHELLYERGDPDRRIRGVTIDQLALKVATAEASPERIQPVRGLFAVARADLVVIEFEFPEVGFIYARSQVDMVPKNAVYRPIADLPEHLTTQLEAAKAHYRELFKRRAKGGGG